MAAHDLGPRPGRLRRPGPDPADIAETVERFARDVPQTEVTALAGCGHSLQEAPAEIGELLAEFFAR